jgi:hypothetical protein
VRGAQARQLFVHKRNAQAATLLQSLFRGVYVKVRSHLEPLSHFTSGLLDDISDPMFDMSFTCNLVSDVA